MLAGTLETGPIPGSGSRPCASPSDAQSPVQTRVGTSCTRPPPYPVDLLSHSPHFSGNLGDQKSFMFFRGHPKIFPDAIPKAKAIGLSTLYTLLSVANQASLY